MIRLDGKQDTDLGIRVLNGYSDPSVDVLDHTIMIPRYGQRYLGNDNPPKVFDFPILIERQATERDLLDKLTQLKWTLFNPDGTTPYFKLVFDAEPEKHFNVRYGGGLDLKRRVTAGEYRLKLIADDPYSYAPADFYDPEFASTYDSGAQYNTGLDYENQIAAPFPNINQYVGVYNYSHYDTPFSFMIEGYVKDPIITNTTTGQYVSFAGLTVQADERLYVDSKLKSAWRIPVADDDHGWSGPNMLLGTQSEWEQINVYHYKDGGFIDLVAGGNTLQFQSSVTPNAQINFHWWHRFI